jgi:hypothetical protein
MDDLSNPNKQVKLTQQSGPIVADVLSKRVDERAFE